MDATVSQQEQTAAEWNKATAPPGRIRVRGGMDLDRAISKSA